MKTKQVVIKFSSTAPKQAYELFITSLRQSIVLNADNKEKLQAIKLELHGAMATVENALYKLWQEGK